MTLLTKGEKWVKPHRCPTPGWFERGQMGVDEGALWQCDECGDLYEWKWGLGWSHKLVNHVGAIDSNGPVFSPGQVEEARKLRAWGYKGRLGAEDYAKRIGAW